MKVLLAVESVRPSYGGPAVSVSRLAVELQRKGLRVGLWTADQSAVEAELFRTSDVAQLHGTAGEALDAFGEPDVLHDNGIWLFHNHRLARLTKARNIPRIVSARGMLEPWAIEHKRLKKRIAWLIYQRKDLVDADVHHASSEQEAINIRRLSLGRPVVVVPNGVDIPCGRRTRGADGRPRIALFLSRLYPVKGLPMLIEAWARIRPNGWRLRVAGPDEAGHRAVVEAAVARFGLQEEISFDGPVEGDEKAACYFESDLFILPSHSESFGMAIGEALAHGLPVLTTTAAPWPMLEEVGCGWRVEPTISGVAEGLARATAIDAATLAVMGEAGRGLVQLEFGWGMVADRFISMYDASLCNVY